MLAETSIVVEKCVSICFLTFYIQQAAPPNVAGLGVIFPLLFLSTGLGALITR